ncbi:MAG: hypothetical protein A3J24_02820 [Deltaproteobacteria bacterium RIFCSPLOWO2_02_FULL_53_8]|nr:MAG: hypothetical protein A3J24_02820 [Deltaproteobacteria bacterium RIFCSPLOWO2_02_FULL_53_8]
MLSIMKKMVIAVVMAAFVFVGNLHAEDAVRAKEPKPGTKEYDDQVILRVNDVEFTRAVIKTTINNLMPAMSMHSSVSDERREKIRVTAVKGLIEDTLVKVEAAKDKELADAITKKDIDEAIDAFAKTLPKGVTLKQAMKNSKMNKKDLREFFKKQMLLHNYYAKVRKQLAEKALATVDEVYIKDYYDHNLAKFVVPEQIHLRMILLKADPSGGTRVWSAVYNRAMELVEKARAGEDFGKMAKELSEDKQTAEKEGDMGWQHRGSLMEELEAVSVNMKPGDVSEPINTLYGYVVVKMEGVKPEVQKTFEEINREKLKNELSDKLLKKDYEAWLSGLKAAAKIEYLSDEVRLK